MGARSRARSPVRRLDGSRPRNRVRRTFLSGESDDTRDSTPAQTRPHVHVSPRSVIGAHANTYTCLRSRLAAVAPFMDAAVTATIMDAVPTVSAAAPPLPIASPVPLQCVRVAAYVCRVGVPTAIVGNGFALGLGILSVGAALGAHRVR